MKCQMSKYRTEVEKPSQLNSSKSVQIIVAFNLQLPLKKLKPGKRIDSKDTKLIEMIVK